MAATHDDTAARALEDGMARVLDAESDARLGVQRCAREAERLLAEAGEREKAIAAAAARRSAAVRAAMARKLERRLAEIDALHERAKASIDAEALEDRRLAQAIERLAAELTRGGP
jgi:hypothetical protein